MGSLQIAQVIFLLQSSLMLGLQAATPYPANIYKDYYLPFLKNSSAFCSSPHHGCLVKILTILLYK
jgi:hypothetical protein